MENTECTGEGGGIDGEHRVHRRGWRYWWRTQSAQVRVEVLMENTECTGEGGGIDGEHRVHRWGWRYWWRTLSAQVRVEVLMENSRAVEVGMIYLCVLAAYADVFSLWRLIHVRREVKTCVHLQDVRYDARMYKFSSVFSTTVIMMQRSILTMMHCTDAAQYVGRVSTRSRYGVSTWDQGSPVKPHTHSFMWHH